MKTIKNRSLKTITTALVLASSLAVGLYQSPALATNIKVVVQPYLCTNHCQPVYPQYYPKHQCTKHRKCACQKVTVFNHGRETVIWRCTGPKHW